MLISSGCLIPLSAIDTIGEMDEELFIDHVDTDWFLRAKSLAHESLALKSIQYSNILLIQFSAIRRSSCPKMTEERW